MAERYDTIGGGYADVRRPDARIAAQVRRALGDARSVVNVGAGTGSYEPPDLDVIAVEPSATMRAQRPAGSAPALDGRAEALPLEDGSVDAAMAILTLHHWSDQAAGLAELQRVARRRIVILTCDPEVGARFWLNRYLPEINHSDDALFPPMAELAARLGGAHRRARARRARLHGRLRGGLLGAARGVPRPARPRRHLDVRPARPGAAGAAAGAPARRPRERCLGGAERGARGARRAGRRLPVLARQRRAARACAVVRVRIAQIVPAASNTRSAGGEGALARVAVARPHERPAAEAPHLEGRAEPRGRRRARRVGARRATYQPWSIGPCRRSSERATSGPSARAVAARDGERAVAAGSSTA